MPFLTEMIWPIFIIFIILIFKEQISSFVDVIKIAVKSGRSLSIGDWVTIGESTSIQDVEDQYGTQLNIGSDIPMEAVEEYEMHIQKGSSEFLNQAKARLRADPSLHFDVLLVKDNMIYSNKVLDRYINSLGIKYVVFINNNHFEGWIDARIFNSQLPPPDTECTYSYDSLKAEITGIRIDQVSSQESAIDVLRKMTLTSLSSLAVIEGTTFRFMTSREAILSKIVTAALLINQRQE